MEFYNTLSKKVEKFVPLKEKEVKVYCCGPTAHDYAHIGNFRTFIFFDILKRALKFNGYKVKLVSNITDVDDKTIKKSIAAGKSLKEHTAQYAKYFFEDIKKLDIEGADLYPLATENIAEMQKIILDLKKKGYA
jgi:cysteinyl-tRNA synthetase